ncbi:MAG: radical SAM protein [Candidatus Bathyarchaeia archaeon]
MRKIRFEPERIRVSVGSAILLGLKHGVSLVPPTTIYMLTYYPGKCLANCSFCSQARESKSNSDHLSRVVWPVFETSNVMEKIKLLKFPSLVERICIQSLNYPNAFKDVLSLVKAIKGLTEIPVSVSCQPFEEKELRALREEGVERVSIPLDAVRKDIFERIKGLEVKGPYSWEEHIEKLKLAVKIFGKNQVTTHLIIGLGEKEVDSSRIIQFLHDLGITIGLFALTPLKGTKMEKEKQPELFYYRKIQLLRYLIVNNFARIERMDFNHDGEIVDFGVPLMKIREVIQTGKPFLTSGCPGCNRPFYNEKISGPIYNFPRALTEKEKAEIEDTFIKIVK